MTKVGESSPVLFNNTGIVKKNDNLPLPTPTANPDIPSYNKNSGVAIKSNYDDSDFEPQNPNLVFKPGSDLIYSDNLDVKIVDNNGIDTNSKGDLDVKLKGQVVFSKKFLDQSISQLRQQLKSQSEYLDLEVNYDSDKNQYNLKLIADIPGPNFEIADVSMTFGDNGINVAYNIGTVPSIAAGLIPGLSAALPLANKKFREWAKDELSNKLGLTVKGDASYFENSFTLVPELQKNQLLKSIPIGSMNVNLEGVVSNGINFKVQPNGDINMNLDATVKGSSGTEQKPAEAKPDTLNAKVDLSYRDNGNVDIAVNAKLNLDVEEREKGELREQIKGFGIDATATGNITVSDISSTTTIVNGQAIQTGKSTASIKAKELNIEAGPTKVQLSSAQGNLGFQQIDKGYKLDLGAGSVSGNVSSNMFSANFNNLKANGSVTYTPGNYNIQGAHISADGININNVVKVKSLDVSGANVNISTNDGAFSVAANKSTKATIKNLSVGNDLKLSGTLSGSIDYNSQGITINGGTSNLRGKIGNFSLDDLDAKGKVSLDKSGNLNLAEVSRFNLATDGMSIKGSQLVLSKNNDVITITDNKSDDHPVKKGQPKPQDISGNLTVISPADKATKTPGKAIVSNLKFEGSIQYNTSTKTLNFNNPKDPLTIKSGSIADVKFNNFKPKGELIIGDDNSVTLKAPASFGGSATFNGVTIGNVNFKANEGAPNGDISFNAANKSVSLNGDVSLELSLPGKTAKDKPISTKINVSGNIDVKPQTIGEGKDKREVIALSSKDGTISGTFGNVNLKDFKFNGQVIYDQKTGDVSLKRYDEQTPLSIKGQLNGADLDLTSNDGTIVLHDPKKNNGNYVIDTGNFQVKGNISGIDVETKDAGISGKITITPDGKPTIEGLDYSVKVGDLELKGKGSAGKTSDGGYEINLSGKIVTDSGKINELLEKVAATPFAKGHEDKLKDLENVLKQVDLTKIKYEDLKISFDKDFNYNISGVATDLDLNISDIPERNISIQNQAPGKISFQMDNQGKMSLSCEGTNINATINGTKFKDFKINGSINYEPTGKNGEPGKITFAPPKKDGDSPAKGMEIAGDIVFDNKGNPLTRKLNLKADADISLIRNGNDLEFTGNNIQLDGMFSDFKIKSIPSGNPPTFANGKFTIKDDGHIDISKLNFNLDVEGIQLSNKDGAFSSTAIDPNNLAKRDYQIKLSGDVNTDIGKFMTFLDKVGNDQITPKGARDSINNTLVSLNKFFKEGNINGNYNLTMDLDENFGLRSFKNETNATISNAKLKLDAIGSPDTLNFDKLNISAVSEVPPATTSGASSSLYIKEGKVNFELTTGLKDSISNAAKNMLAKAIVDNSGGKIKAEDVDLKVDVQPDGGLTVNGSIKGIPIIDKVKIGGGVTFEGTTVNVEIDKVKLAGLLGGIIQFVARPFTGDLKERVTDEVVKGAAANGFALDYSGKNKFSIDLQGVLNQYVNDSVKLSDVKIENNQVTVKYEASYGADKTYDMQKINDSVDLIKKLVVSKDKKEIATLSNAVLPKLSSLTPQEMSMTFDRVGFTDELFKKLGKDKTCELMKKLLDNQGKDRNFEHLTRLVKTVSKSNNSKEGIRALSDFIKFINESKKAGTPVTVTPELANILNTKVKELK